MPSPEVDLIKREHPLERHLPDVAGGERVACDDRRPVGIQDLETRVRDRLPVERAEIARGVADAGLTGTEALLSTQVEGQLLLQSPLVLREEARHAAEVIVMAVA